MLVIVGGRKTGKTHQLIEWVTDRPGRTILCADVTRAGRLKAEYGLSNDQVRVPGNMRNGRQAQEVGIDDAETLLRTFIGSRDTLGAVSLTGPDEFLGQTTEEPDTWLSVDDEQSEPFSWVKANECHGFGAPEIRHSGGVPSPGWSGPNAGLPTQCWEP